VIIEPGTVNTAMYDKSEKEDLSEPISIRHHLIELDSQFQFWHLRHVIEGGPNA
jgi:hypothetical protein